ncbi:hypothetical protein AB0N77_09670 [Streptomyces misionensis]|uniref:hypothetical protein n=1 Tax=Streptomyces misionensis TaxID=67331 RepID=UPI00342F7304
MTDRIPLDHLTSDALDALYDELDRLHAGEEPGWSKGIKPTAGQWIARWNQTSPEERLRAAEQVIDNGATAERCFLMNHEKRLARAEATIARVRELRDTWLRMTLEPGQVRRLLDGITTALDQPAPAAAPQPREHCGDAPNSPARR